MKKCFAVLLALVLLVSLALPAFASRDVSFETELAGKLKELGLFKGVSDTDFALGRAPTRLEALMMLIRALGKESEAASGSWTHPFTDVSAWWSPYVGFAYETKLTNGISATEFGTANAGANMYLTFMLRALGYADGADKDFLWNNPYPLAKEIGILPDRVNTDEFWRADVVSITYAALGARMKGTEQTLAEKLIAAGVFSRETFDAVYRADAFASSAAAGIEVSDLCAISGKLVDEGGFISCYSFCLPKISGADTPWVREINADMERLYDELVKHTLDYMEESGYLMRYCVSYLHGEKDGVHSLLITADSDWDDMQYWCYSFDNAGNKVENEAVLKAVGMMPESFVSAVRDYLTEYTRDMDDSWEELRAQTLSEDNCNAELPMAILPDGKLCFITTLYTPAGAGAYECALEFSDTGKIEYAGVGSILLNRLTGTYLVAQPEPDEDDESFAPAYYLEIFTVGDTLTAEVTAFDPEYGDVYYYYGADIFPEDPSALLRADVSELRVRVVSWCPDVMGSSYYGEPGVYTLAVGRDYVAFSDFEGGTPFVGVGFTAKTCYRDQVKLDSEMPAKDYEKFDYAAVSAAGIAGVWGGSYYDVDTWKPHSVTMELTNWGELKLRDCVDGEIPRVLEGQYYIAKEGDDFAPAGAVVYSLVARGGYKMPYMGWCTIEIGADGALRIDEGEDSYSPLLKHSPYAFAELTRVPAQRCSAQPQIRKLAEGETVSVDVFADGTPEKLSCSFTRDEDVITAVSFFVDGVEYTETDQWYNDADVWLVTPGLGGAAYFYVDQYMDNDYRYMQIFRAGADGVRRVGDYGGGFAEAPTDVESLQLYDTFQFLSTMEAARTYRVGTNGLPEATEPFFYALGDLTLTAKQDVDFCWIVTPDSGELMDTMTLPAGTQGKLLRTDGAYFWDLLLADGSCVRVWIDADSWPQTVSGVDVGECFDGIVFAG